VILIVLASFSWFDGPHIRTIDIRLIENQQEAQEEGRERLLSGDNPDYQVIFFVKGNKIMTNTLCNSTARSWLSLQPERNFEIADIDKFHIVNKQVLEDKVLETVFDPELRGIGQYYEYRIIED
jgi:hypothetical protein